jgi:hypothetical protein
MPAAFKRAVKHIQAKGHSKESAYAIATATFKKAGKSTKHKPTKKGKKK